MTEQVQIGVIGGSGLYKMPEIEDIRAYDIDTPFGKPSAEILVGTLGGKRVAFLPRHGLGHYYTPTTVPYRANIYALKMMGARFVIGVNAAGSLREDYEPGHIVIPDQLYDHTKADRGRTFFDTGMVGHVSVADPLCAPLGDLLREAVAEVGGTAHRGGTFIIIEGPRFSTRGESEIFRQWGCSVIGMTTCPEAFLAAEAEIAYAAMAHITDYDVWHQSEEPVTVEMVVATMGQNIRIAQQAIAAAIAKLDETADWDCHHTLDHAVMTAPDQISPEMREKLSAITGRLFADS